MKCVKHNGKFYTVSTKGMINQKLCLRIRVVFATSFDQIVKVFTYFYLYLPFYPTVRALQIPRNIC